MSDAVPPTTPITTQTAALPEVGTGTAILKCVFACLGMIAHCFAYLASLGTWDNARKRCAICYDIMRHPKTHNFNDKENLLEQNALTETPVRYRTLQIIKNAFWPNIQDPYIPLVVDECTLLEFLVNIGTRYNAITATQELSNDQRAKELDLLREDLIRHLKDNETQFPQFCKFATASSEGERSSFEGWIYANHQAIIKQVNATSDN